MKRKLIASISATVVLALCVPAQEGPERSGNDRGHPTSRDHGDKRPAKVHLRAFLRKHPKLFHELRKAADKDGDGRLNSEERAYFLEMAREKASAKRQEHQEKREDRQQHREDWRDKRADHMEDRAEKRREHREDRREGRQENRSNRRQTRQQRQSRRD